MTALFSLIDQIAIGIYILVAVVIVWQLRRWLMARTELRATYFELERDLAQVQQGVALTTVVLALQFAFVVAGVQQVIVPFLRMEDELSVELSQTQVEDGEFSTATPAPVAQSLDIEPVPPLEGDNETILVLTPTLTPTPVGTIIPNAPAAEGCTDERATLQVPANGMRVFQPMTVIGQAYTDEFSTAKIEVSGPSTNGGWAVDGVISAPARELQGISEFIPSRYSQGEYRLRLVVFDITNTIVAYCAVTIYISPPVSTATPTPLPEGGGLAPIVSTATPQ